VTIDFAALAHHHWRGRRQRDALLGTDYACEAGWDILLDLRAAEGQRRKVSVSSACAASSVPPTTALRWIGHLVRDGLVWRTPDPVDRRRFFLGLTVQGRDIVDRSIEPGPALAGSRLVQACDGQFYLVIQRDEQRDQVAAARLLIEQSLKLLGGAS
jgi:DNA-binding MarR family transcriptional regulator